VKNLVRVCLVLWACALTALAPPLWDDEPASEVDLILRVVDEETGSELDLRAECSLPGGTKAFDAMKKLVVMDYDKSLGGVFVKGICGVKAPKGTFWSFHVNGEYQKVGISSVVLDRDMEILWKLQDISKMERPTRDQVDKR
jgi:hypothetical protein